MLFNSYAFALVFLPIALAGFYALGHWRHQIAIVWLVLCSLFFYAYWKPIYLVLLLASIAFNYSVGRWLAMLAERADARCKYVLTFGVAINLAALGYFKYANFIVANLNELADTDFVLEAVILPLAISFYTFQQIAYLVDTARGEIRGTSFLHYCTCVAFFPHLIAGPIVLYREILPQFAARDTSRFDHSNFAAGATFFAIGLFKKVVLADGVAIYASPVFAAAAAGTAPTLVESWGAALAYTLQLYFDFSGYCDMAIGLALMFNIRLPVNFNSPYQAVNIIDFWRRWHITLSRFLRDYVYIALGGNRHGVMRRYVNLFLTMLIGGVWHGAGWTFAVWGALHGVYLIINHAWHAIRRHLGVPPREPHGIGRRLGVTITLLAVIVGWVIFRASSLDAAWLMMRGMAGVNGITLPPYLADHLARFLPFLPDLGISFAHLPLFYGPPQAAWIIALMSIVLLAPNSQQLMGYAQVDRAWYRSHMPPAAPNWLRWTPNPVWATVIALCFVYTLAQMSDVSEFLYFQF